MVSWPDRGQKRLARSREIVDRGSHSIEERRRAVIEWLGEREKTGATQTVKGLYDALIGADRPFATEAQAWAAISDLDDEHGSGHVRLIRGPQDFAYALALTEKGRASYDAMRRGLWGRIVDATAPHALTIVVAAVTAVVTTIVAKLVERWLFP